MDLMRAPTDWEAGDAARPFRARSERDTTMTDHRPTEPTASPVDIREVVVTHRAEIYRYARSFTHNDADADDLTQTAVLRAMRHNGLRDPERAKWYLLRIVRNLATDQARARARISVEPHADVPEVASTEPGPIDLVVLDEIRNDQRAALDALSAAHREVLELRFFEELDYEAVARRLQVTEQAARQRVYRAMQALRALVHESRLRHA